MTEGRSAAPGVAVLGGTGWLGSHVCDVFARHGYRVVAIARHPASRDAAHRFVPLDLVAASSATILDVLRSETVAVVVNATDSTNAVDGWVRTEEEHFRLNRAAVDRILEAMAGLPARGRLVHLGTLHEYGPVAPGTSIDESVVPNPVNAYARSKLAGSEAVLDAARAGIVDGVVLRLVNLCGPYPSADSFPGKLLRAGRQALRTGHLPVTVADDSRDFLDVRDAAEAVFRAATEPATVAGRVLNIGSGTVTSIRELVALFAAAAGLPAAAVEERARPVDSFGGAWIKADPKLAGELLDWRPRIPLADSLRAMWQSYESA